MKSPKSESSIIIKSFHQRSFTGRKSLNLTRKLAIVLAALVAVLIIGIQQQNAVALKDGKFVYNQRNHLSCTDVDTPEIECEGNSGFVANNVIPGKHENENFNDHKEDKCKVNSHNVPNKGSDNNNNNGEEGNFCDPLEG
jgi:hypothetical protein